MMKEIQQGEVIYSAGQKINVMYMIMRGTVSVTYPGGKYFLRSGDVIGLCEAGYTEAYMEYRAQEKLSVLAYPFGSTQLKELFNASNDAVKYFLSSFFRQFNEILGQYKLLKNEGESLYEYLKSIYEDYQKLCEKYHITPGEPASYEELTPLSLEEEIPEWISGYYSTLEQMLTVWDHNKTDCDFACGFLLKSCQDIQHILSLCCEMQEYQKDICRYLMNESGMDMLGLMLDLYGKIVRAAGAEADDVISLRRGMDDVLHQLEGCEDRDFHALDSRKEQIAGRIAEFEKRSLELQQKTVSSGMDMQEISGSLEKILSYAGCEAELSDSFRKHVERFKKVSNKNGTEDDIRRLRQEIAKEFNQIYISAFQNSVKNEDIPKVVKMFFEFGYVDEELAGIENAQYLYEIADKLPTNPDQGVYSLYEWLMAIFEEHKEPGRNEFDMDYTGYLHEQKRMGKISAQQESELLQNNSAKVMYELENVFPTVNKVTFGRISTFCPLFSEHNVLKPLDTMLVSEKRIKEVLDGIRKKDFGAYYRETMYSQPEQGIPKEFIHVEILPDIILMPNVGTRGVMWQEIEGKRRTTPARMMTSVFQLEDLALILIRLTGEFRWEMCKRVQGARWNDISEKSLTSEYFDYVQFYKRNQDLSPDAKDKIKTDLGRAKNSFKEMFLKDYALWILYESNGAPRLNKVARTIFFNNCPFTKPLREKLKANPLYRELADRYEIRMEQKRHRMDNICQKLRSQGKDIPEEIQREAQYLNM